MFSSMAASENVDVAASELPKPVTDAVMKHFPKATVIAAEKEMTNGETIYKVKYKIVETVGTCVVTADGILKDGSKPQ